MDLHLFGGKMGLPPFSSDLSLKGRGSPRCIHSPPPGLHLCEAFPLPCCPNLSFEHLLKFMKKDLQVGANSPCNCGSQILTSAYTWPLATIQK